MKKCFYCGTKTYKTAKFNSGQIVHVCDVCYAEHTRTPDVEEVKKEKKEDEN